MARIVGSLLICTLALKGLKAIVNEQMELRRLAGR